MRTFVTKCVVGDIVTEGEGNGKKVSSQSSLSNISIVGLKGSN